MRAQRAAGRNGPSARCGASRRAAGDEGAAADPSFEEALAGEALVGFADGLARHFQAFGEVARGWQAIAGGQATMEDRVAQLAIELADQVVAAVEDQLQFHGEIGYLVFLVIGSSWKPKAGLVLPHAAPLSTRGCQSAKEIRHDHPPRMGQSLPDAYAAMLGLEKALAKAGLERR